MKIQRSLHITEVDFTAGQWQLFTATMDCTQPALMLNDMFKNSVNAGVDRDTVEDNMLKLMNKLSHYGASDSEPCWKLTDLLDEVFGLKIKD